MTLAAPGGTFELSESIELAGCPACGRFVHRLWRFVSTDDVTHTRVLACEACAETEEETR